MLFQDVSYIAESKAVLSEISFSVEKGELLSVMGASGSGKSTLLKLCCHLVSPSAGCIRVDGKDIMAQEPTELRRKIAYCPQTPILFGQTVEENLSFPYHIRRQKPDRARALELMCLFGLDSGMLTQNVQKLSGGEKQRVALARTLLFSPGMLLLDEVTSALDAENARAVEQAVRALNADGVTVLWVTHNAGQSRRVAGRQMVLGNGRIQSLEALR